MRTTFANALMELARKDEKIFLLTPDMGFSVFEEYAKAFPGRFLNTGIAEQNTIAVAAGLALFGFKPYVYSIAPFVLMRCFEQVRLCAAYMRANIKIVGAGGGVAYGPAGTTHHIIEDFAIAKALPNMTVCAPADPIEMRCIIEQSARCDSPMYIRIAKNNDRSVHGENDVIAIGKAFTLENGGDLEFITAGTIALRVTQWLPELRKQGISAGVTVFHTIKPLDTACLDSLIESGKKIIVVEEHNAIGGLGESVCAYFGKKNAKNKIRHLAIPDAYSHYVGSQEYILDKFGLHAVPDIGKLFSQAENDAK